MTDKRLTGAEERKNHIREIHLQNMARSLQQNPVSSQINLYNFRILPIIPTRTKPITKMVQGL